MKQSLVVEHQLLERLRHGESRAVREWFALYAAEVRRFVAGKVTDAVDVEELVQETFIQSLKSLALFHGNASIVTWMKGIAKHEVADYYRKKYAKQALKTSPLQALVTHASVHDAHDVSERVKAALHEIREDYRELLLLKYVDGKTVKHIARELGRTVKSIEADLFRARQDFKTAYVTARTT